MAIDRRVKTIVENTRRKYLLKNLCANCGAEIIVMAFRGLGFCCDDCRKALGKDIK